MMLKCSSEYNVGNILYHYMEWLRGTTASSTYTYVFVSYSGPKQFMRTCDITGVTDDLTIGVIIGTYLCCYITTVIIMYFTDMVLGYKLINTETMYTQSVNLIHLNKKNLTKLVSDTTEALTIASEL